MSYNPLRGFRNVESRRVASCQGALVELPGPFWISLPEVIGQVARRIAFVSGRYRTLKKPQSPIKIHPYDMNSEIVCRIELVPRGDSALEKAFRSLGVLLLDKQRKPVGGVILVPCFDCPFIEILGPLGILVEKQVCQIRQRIGHIPSRDRSLIERFSPLGLIFLDQIRQPIRRVALIARLDCLLVKSLGPLRVSTGHRIREQDEPPRLSACHTYLAHQRLLPPSSSCTTPLE